jgi:RNA recognition motif-containing protein
MNLYVSNLSFHTGDDDLRKLFEQFGSVTSAKVISDRTTGRSRGFGFVEMDSETEAKEAIKGLNNKEIEGRSMSVSVAKERPSRPDNKRW